MSVSQESFPSIPEYFEGKCIFITGGTGFIGKVLIEKILRSCPNVKVIYILIRQKRGKSVRERMQDVFDIPLFDQLKDLDKDAVKKVAPIVGDIKKLNLGISEKDRQMLISEVNIVYHCSASIRFDDFLNDAILLNVRSAREIVNMAKEFKQLDVFVHVSTTYCNVDKPVLEEKIYPALSHWRDAIYIAETVNPDVLQALTEKYIHPFPNTYTYTKQLAEHTVEDLCSESNIPTIICRPSIVIGSLSEPLPGWGDTFNGPFVLALGGFKGIMSLCYCKPQISLNLVYVDNVVKSLIAATWLKAMTKSIRYEITFYNACNELLWPLERFCELAPTLIWDVPQTNILWYGGNVRCSNCWYYYYLWIMVFNVIPSLCLDPIIKSFGKMPLLMKVTRRLYIANMALLYFVSNSWDFKNDNYIKLEEQLLERDKEAFMFYSLCPKTYDDIYEYTKKVMIGINKYLLHEVQSEENYKNTYRLYVLDKAVRIIFYGLMLYWLFKYNVCGIVVQKIVDYFNSIEAQ